MADTPGTPNVSSQDPNAAATPPALPPELSDAIVQRDGKFGIRSVVDGQEQFVPLDIARMRLQKADAADARLAQASELLKKHQTAIQYYDLTQKGLQGDRDAGRQALALVGLDEPDDPPVEQFGRGQRNAPAPNPKLDQLATFLQRAEKAGVDPLRAMQTALELDEERTTTSRFTELDRAAENDPVLGRILKSRPDIAQLVLDEVHGRALAQVGGNAPFEPRVYVPVIREIAAKYNTLLGTQSSQRTPVPDPIAEMRQSLGLGPASSAGYGTAQMADDRDIEPTTPIRAKDGDYGRNFESRLLQGLSREIARRNAYGE